MSLTVPRSSKLDRRERRKVFIPAPLEKMASKAADPAGSIRISGYASTWVKDRDDEYVDPHAFDRTIDDYMSTNPMVLYAHCSDWPLGKCEASSVDLSGLRVEDLVTQPIAGEVPEIVTAYSKIKSDVLKTFSIGGYFTRDIREVGPTDMAWIIVEVELMEHSVVAIPSNPLSIFGVVEKAFGGPSGSARATLGPSAVETMKQLLGMRSLSDPILQVMSEPERRAHFEHMKGLYASVGLASPEYDSYRVLGSTLARFDSPEGAKAALGGKDARGREAVGELLSALAMAEGHVPLGAKAGRVLSKRNESTLREAVEKAKAAISDVEDVLAQVAEQADDDVDADLGAGYILGRAARSAAMDSKAALSLATLPFASRDRAWDAGAAKARVHGDAEADSGYSAQKLGRAYLWRDDDSPADQPGSYRFIVADLIGGALTYVPRGIEAAANVLQGGRGGTSVGDAGVEALKAKVSTLYGRMRSEVDGFDLRPPWEGS